MKGTIHYCLEATIKHEYGADSWAECQQAVGLKRTHSFGQQILQDINENDSINLFRRSAETLDVELKTLFDQFGDYWCTVHAPGLYPQFFEKAQSTKDMLVGLDHIHQIVIGKKPGAQPPRFTYEWQKDGRLLMTYLSERGLFELFESLLRGLDKKFNSRTTIERVGENSLLLDFE